MGGSPAGGPEDEVVAVDDLPLVRRAELARQLVGGPADQVRQLVGVVVDQPPGHRHTVRVDQVHGVAADERAAHAGDAGGEQRGAAVHDGADGALVEHHLALGLGGVREPEQPGRPATAGGVEHRADVVPGEARAALSAEVSTTGMPAPVAIRAASTFVCMPPVPTPADPVPPIRTSSRSSSEVTSESSVVPAASGWPSYRPSTSESRSSRSACTRWATSAASRSLSPKRISAVATVSFSLTIGSTPSSSSLAKVR